MSCHSDNTQKHSTTIISDYSFSKKYSFISKLFGICQDISQISNKVENSILKRKTKLGLNVLHNIAYIKKLYQILHHFLKFFFH